HQLDGRVALTVGDGVVERVGVRLAGRQVLEHAVGVVVVAAVGPQRQQRAGGQRDRQTHVEGRGVDLGRRPGGGVGVGVGGEHGGRRGHAQRLDLVGRDVGGRGGRPAVVDDGDGDGGGGGAAVAVADFIAEAVRAAGREHAVGVVVVAAVGPQPQQGAGGQ